MKLGLIQIEKTVMFIVTHLKKTPASMLTKMCEKLQLSKERLMVNQNCHFLKQQIRLCQLNFKDKNAQQCTITF